MLIGNFMLLNLFLAILLKSISEIGNNEDGDADKDESTKAEQSKQEDGDKADEAN